MKWEIKKDSFALGDHQHTEGNSEISASVWGRSN
jgi:hypothetical protein